MAELTEKPRKRRRIALKLGFAIVAVWIAGDFIYSRVVAWKAQRWEATVQRDAEGVAAGCGAYDRSPAEGVPPRGALLLVHGINASPRHYDKMAPRLAQLGFHCRVMRLPGFAEPLDSYASHGRADWIAAVDDELAALRESHARVGVVAHSLGGAVTICQLLAEPDSADFAVLLAPAVAVSDARSPVLSTRAWHNVGNALLLFTDTLQSPFAIDSHDPANANYPGRCPFTPRPVVDELFALMSENRPRAVNLKTPLLMVLTEDDRVIDWRAASEFFDAVGAEPKRRLQLEDSGHAIPIDYGWRDVTDAIAAFAAELESSSQ